MVEEAGVMEEAVPRVVVMREAPVVAASVVTREAVSEAAA